MVDYWNITATAFSKLNTGVDSVVLNYIFLYILIAGFLSLTFSFVLTKRDKYWSGLDIFSKSAVSLIVGSISYLVVIMGHNLIKIINLIFTQEFEANTSLNYYGFIAMIFIPYIIIIFSQRYSKKKKGVDQLNILNYLSVSFSLFIGLFLLSLGILFIIIAISGLIVQCKLFLLLILLFGLISTYGSYCMFSNALRHLINKPLPYALDFPLG